MAQIYKHRKALQNASPVERSHHHQHASTGRTEEKFSWNELLTEVQDRWKALHCVEAKPHGDPCFLVGVPNDSTYRLRSSQTYHEGAKSLQQKQWQYLTRWRNREWGGTKTKCSIFFKSCVWSLENIGENGEWNSPVFLVLFCVEGI